MPLAPCPQCARHVRLPTSPCPFCGGDTTLARPARAWRVTSSRYTRAAIFAGAALMASCSETEAPPAQSAAEEAAPTPEPPPPEPVAEPESAAMEPVTPVPTEQMEAERATEDQAAIGAAEDQEEEEAQAAPADERRRRRRRRVVADVEEAIEDIHIPRPPYGAPPMREDWPV